MWGAAKDRRKLKGINWRYLRPPKSATTADGFSETAMKSYIHKHPTHLDQRPLRPPKLNNAILVWSSFGGLRGLWSGFVRCLCAFSWLFQWQYRLAWPTSAAGDSFAARADLCHQYSLLLVSLTPVKNLSPVSLTPVRNNQKAKNWSPVSTIPLKIFSVVTVTLAITEPCQY